MTVSKEAIKAAKRAYDDESLDDDEAFAAALTAALPHLLPQPTASDAGVKPAHYAYRFKWLFGPPGQTCVRFDPGEYNGGRPIETIPLYDASALAAVRAEATLAATLAERERCAQVALTIDGPEDFGPGRMDTFAFACEAIAAAIRRAE